MDLQFSIGFTLLFLLTSFFIYRHLASKGTVQGLRCFTLILLLMASVLLFININLYNSARIQIKSNAVIERYMIPATMDLIGSVHDPNNKIHMEENRIYINQGTDKEKVFILMREPFFGVLDQSQSVQLSNELGNLR